MAIFDLVKDLLGGKVEEITAPLQDAVGGLTDAVTAPVVDIVGGATDAVTAPLEEAIGGATESIAGVGGHVTGLTEAGEAMVPDVAEQATTVVDDIRQKFGL